MHRDIKPANIMVNWNGETKLTDFGVSRNFNNTTTISTVGTFEYMAPEYFSTQRFNDKADIWSLGITLLEVASGGLNFFIRNNETVNTCNLRIVNAKEMIENFNIENALSQLSDLYSDTLKEFIRKCLVVDYAKRINFEDLDKTELYLIGSTIDKELINVSSTEKFKGS